MLKMTRKEFLRTGLSLVAAAGLPTSIATAAARAAVADRGGAKGVPIPQLNPVARLYPYGAVERSGEIRFGPAELGVMLPFFGSGEVVWNVTVPDSGRYQLDLCYAATAVGTQITISAGEDNVVSYATEATEGFFYSDPKGPSANPGGPDDDSFWSMREFYSFERMPLTGELSLSRGLNVIRLKVTAAKGKEVFRLRSLELTPVAQRASIDAARALARRQRANTDWFAHAGYGMWFHFLDLTTPRHGPRKPYKDAVDELDAEKLAQLVEECGAKYLIFTVNHGNPTCPAPIAAWEAVHPGWTTRRDLIGDLADALGRRGIKLMLYMNCPGLGNLVQLPGPAIDRPALSEAEYADRLIRVFREFGERYKDRLAGYWLDSWFQTIETYPNLPFDRLGEAIKAGHRDRLVAYNHWTFPVETDWQDYWTGELTDLPLKPFKSRYIRRGAGQGLQAHAAIRLDAPWFHITPDKDMEPPRYTAAELAEYIKSCMADAAPVTLGVGIFQDGSIGEPSRQVLTQLRHLVRRT